MYFSIPTKSATNKITVNKRHFPELTTVKNTKKYQN